MIKFSIMIGNLSNPSINRWGLNLFWYNYWYSDKINHLHIQQDKIFNELIWIYLFFGLSFYQNIFISKLWYEPSLKKKDFLFDLTKYYRKVEFVDTILNEETSFNFRIYNNHLLNSKIWILKYQGWIIISFYNFIPMKKKKQTKVENKHTLHNYLITRDKTNSRVRRFLLIFSWLNYRRHELTLYKF